MIERSASKPLLKDRLGLTAPLLYLALSLIFFARSLPGHFFTFYLGRGPDPSQFMWSFVWWPYAIARHLNPLVTHMIWAPTGLNLAWATTVPLASIVMFPFTHWLGPVAAYNILQIVVLPLNAWAAFVLCRYITRSFWASFLGGYIFGFSPYMLGQLPAHLHLVLAFPIPLVVYVAARRFNSEMGTRAFVGFLGLLLTVQFLFSIETFATMTVFGAMAIALGISFAPPELKRRARSLVIPVLAGYALALAAVSPYLYCLFALGLKRGQIWSPDIFSVDLLNFAIPTQTNLTGHLRLFESISSRFLGNIFEQGAYLGLPLIVIAAVYAWHHWREPLGKLLVDSLMILCMLSMGPFLHIGGRQSIPLPGMLLSALPLIDKALPARFMMYAFLDLAIVVSIWLTAGRKHAAAKYALSLLAVVFLVPNFSARFWTSPVDTPAFFSRGLYKSYLAPGETAMVLPFGLGGNSMLWQAESGMYFRLTGGWLGPVQDQLWDWPIVPTLYEEAYLPRASDQLKAFLANRGVRAIIVRDREESVWRPLLSTFGVAPLDVGGVSLYRISVAALTAYRGLTALAMEKRAYSQTLDGLILATEQYLADGQTPGSLSPSAIAKMGLLPGDWLIGPPNASYWGDKRDPHFDKGLWLGPLKDGRIGIGLAGSWAGLKPAIQSYRSMTARIYFPYARQLSSNPPKEGRWLLVMAFDRAGLASAARLARTRLTAEFAGTMNGRRSPTAGKFSQPASARNH